MPSSKQARGSGSSCTLPKAVVDAKNIFDFKGTLDKVTEKKSFKGY